ncbi:MAG: tyrosine-type recombinase/integrase [Sporichthyaceae bacterium]|nr:tyrosine-type recombinase/integrase [Sporichthyaceae bacterium]
MSGSKRSLPGPRDAPQRLDDLSRSFARRLRAEGKAQRTAVIYGQALRSSVAGWSPGGREPTLEEMSRASVREWLATLAERNELSTGRTRYKGLHPFCSWLVAEGEIEANPLGGLEPPVAEAKPVPVLPDNDLVRLLKACAGKDFRDRRDEAVIRLLLDCGVRVSELCGLKLGDVDLDREMALVTGKGNKVRPVYFGARTARALDRYRRERARQRHAHLEAFFLSQRGGLTPDGVRDLVNVRGPAGRHRGAAPAPVPAHVRSRLDAARGPTSPAGATLGDGPHHPARGVRAVGAGPRHRRPRRDQGAARASRRHDRPTHPHRTRRHTMTTPTAADVIGRRPYPPARPRRDG